ncbi:MAG: hypothetical protein CVU87_12275 [Firmicutes bacterium HGW-Firmicutes-12]|jgi:hypothetical protein|nr:MAG: hypothetical protein CVU87_12275 [Firmicutes bacterium HGW-Firmicutes-12]
MKFTDNGDGTVTDLNTGLMWQQDPGSKMTWVEAMSKAEVFELAGYTDWRMPTIKELYSLIDFSGTDPSGWNGEDISTLIPFIDLMQRNIAIKKECFYLQQGICE